MLINEYELLVLKIFLTAEINELFELMRLFRIADQTQNGKERDYYLSNLAIKYFEQFDSVNVTPEVIKLWNVYFSLEIEFKKTRIKEFDLLRDN